MATITLPPDLEAWARAEVAAGRSESVEAAVSRGVRGYQLASEAFRRSLNDAEAEAANLGWVPGDQFLSELDQWIAELSLAGEREDVAGAAAE